ncbi:amidohydrolase family protein [Stenotrophomonas sp. S48]|uniref:amidohydrolase family protein n=1 Tax=unclassified Stenotrophomonas TaxID=196198 RepID=UPI0019024EEB|nr:MULTISPECIES: amidohydrolase family protein [unclassified Stenotrophomonas]MBK0028136.1 amidohydrolase family protein [Stenotrophomonas sp. S48]MBK0049980.1 amidohydrolase family protein [Stenotrophomonas sp. S49]
MTLQFVHGGVDRHGAPLHFHIRDGQLQAINAAGGAAEGAENVNLAGFTVLPGLVDGHIHLDKSFVGDRWHPHQSVASLRERLAVEKAAVATAAPMVERAEALIRQCSAFGTVAMRCHVDIDASTGLQHLQAVREAAERCADIMQIQLVAFPQAGVMSCPGTAEVLRQALDAGVQVLGGIDPTTLDGDADGQLALLFGLAERHAVRLDIHLHEPGETGLAQLLRIAARTQAAGLQGRVAVSHAYALGEVPLARALQVGEALARAGVAIMSNAPGDHPFPPLRALHDAGVRVFAGNDNIRDCWWPYGNGDLLQRAMLLGYRSGFYTDADLDLALDMVTTHAAQAIGLQQYGIDEGLPATFVAVRADHGPAAVAGVPVERRVVVQGRWL